MNARDVSQVLAKAAAFDNRTIGEAEILVWLEAIGDLPLEDALTAVTRHYRESTEWLKPVHVREQVLAIRNERAKSRHHEVLELPSRFEPDEIRDARVRAGVTQLAKLLAVPTVDSDDPRARAIARARQERGGRPIPGADRRKPPAGKPIDLSKIPGPAWSDPAVRERVAIQELHAADRPCGRLACSKPTCANERTSR